MNLGLSNKNVVVMASSQGIGKGIALEFAKAGAHVFLTSRNLASLEETAEELKQQSGNDKISYATCDMTSHDNIINFFQTVENEMGQVDVLVNNTGGPRAGGFEAISDEEWSASFEQNLLSYIRTARAVIPHMKENNFGRIINVSSSSTKEAIDNLILSNTFRAGIVGLTKSLAREFAASNILVNAVGPGRFETDRIVELDTATAEKEGVPIDTISEQNTKRIPMGRYGQPEEFGKVVVFLASAANTYLTGQSLIVDGGSVKAL